MIKAMVAFVPDPYIALYFKHLYDTVWKDQVDGLLVQVNGERKEVVDFIADIYKDEFVIKHYHHSNQGIAFDELYEHFDGDILMTLCSDNFIYKKEVIATELRELEKFDVVGSSGLHATPPAMADKISDKIGFCRVNPFMSFWKADKLKKIEPFTFQAINKEVGDRIEYIDMDYEIEGRLDVMTDMSIKYLAGDNKAFIHGADNPPYWMHASGLSSAVYGHLVHSDGKDLGGTKKNKHYSRDAAYKLGHLAWLYLCYSKTVDKCPLKDFNKEYINALEVKAEKNGFTMNQVKEKSKEFDYED